MNVREWQAHSAEEAGRWLAHFINTTHEDKLDWRPTAEGGSNARSVMEIAHECIQTNRRLVGLLRGVPPDPENPGHPIPTTREQVVEALVDSAADVADAIRSLDDEAMQRTYHSPMGDLPGSLLVALPSIHMHYHGGQVNYIQLLYGDTQFHVPGRDSQ